MAPKFVKEVLLQLKSHIDPYRVIVNNFSTPLLPINKPSRQKLNREMLELSDIVSQMDLADICKTFYPNTKEYTFFSVPHRTFFKISYICGHEESLNRHKKIEIILRILPDHHG